MGEHTTVQNMGNTRVQTEGDKSAGVLTYEGGDNIIINRAGVHAGDHFLCVFGMLILQ